MIFACLNFTRIDHWSCCGPCTDLQRQPQRGACAHSLARLISYIHCTVVGDQLAHRKWVGWISGRIFCRRRARFKVNVRRSVVHSCMMSEPQFLTASRRLNSFLWMIDCEKKGFQNYMCGNVLLTSSHSREATFRTFTLMLSTPRAPGKCALIQLILCHPTLGLPTPVYNGSNLKIMRL